MIVFSQIFWLILGLLNFILATNLDAAILLNIWCFFLLCLNAAFIVSDKKIGWLLFYYMLAVVIPIGGCLVLEVACLYLTEIQDSAYLTGASARSASLGLIFISGSYLWSKLIIEKFTGRHWTIRVIRNSELSVFKFAIIITIIYLIGSLYFTDAPIFSGQSRFNYFIDSAPYGYRNFYVLLPFYSLIISFAGVRGLISKSRVIFLNIVFIIIMILTGEKFSLYLDLAFYSLCPYIIRGFIDRDKYFYGKISLFIGGLVLYVIFTYLRRGESIDYFYDRLALQGQMIFALDLVSGGSNETNLDVIINSFFGFADDLDNVGMYHLMWQIAPADTVEEMFNYNMSFTAPFPANFIFFFKPLWAPLAVLVYSLVVSLAVVMFYKAINGVSLSNLFISATVYHYVNMITSMGQTERLIKPIFLICISFLLLISMRFKSGK